MTLLMVEPAGMGPTSKAITPRRIVPLPVELTLPAKRDEPAPLEHTVQRALLPSIKVLSLVGASSAVMGSAGLVKRRSRSLVRSPVVPEKVEVSAAARLAPSNTRKKVISSPRKVAEGG